MRRAAVAIARVVGLPATRGMAHVLCSVLPLLLLLKLELLLLLQLQLLLLLLLLKEQLFSFLLQLLLSPFFVNTIGNLLCQNGVDTRNQ